MFSRHGWCEGIEARRRPKEAANGLPVANLTSLNDCHWFTALAFAETSLNRQFCAAVFAVENVWGRTQNPSWTGGHPNLALFARLGSGFSNPMHGTPSGNEAGAGCPVQAPLGRGCSLIPVKRVGFSAEVGDKPTWRWRYLQAASLPHSIAQNAIECGTLDWVGHPPNRRALCREPIPHHRAGGNTRDVDQY